MTGLERLMNRSGNPLQKTHPRSFRLFRRAQNVMIQGGSHSLRLHQRPIRFSSAGPRPRGRRHRRERVCRLLAGALCQHPRPQSRDSDDPPAGRRTTPSPHTGFEGKTRSSWLRFSSGRPAGRAIRSVSTSGTLAAMYAVMLACGRTGPGRGFKDRRRLARPSPFFSKGIAYDRSLGFTKVESAGVPSAFSKKIHTVRCSDSEGLIRFLRRRGRKSPVSSWSLISAPEGIHPGRPGISSDGPGMDIAPGDRPRFRRDHFRIPIRPDRSRAPGRRRTRSGDIRQSDRGRAAIAAVMGRTGHPRMSPAPGRPPDRGPITGRDVFRPPPKYAGRSEDDPPFGPTRPGNLSADRGGKWASDSAAESRTPSPPRGSTRCAGRGNDVIPGSSLFMPHFLRVRHEIREAGTCSIPGGPTSG